MTRILVAHGPAWWGESFLLPDGKSATGGTVDKARQRVPFAHREIAAVTNYVSTLPTDLNVMVAPGTGFSPLFTAACMNRGLAVTRVGSIGLLHELIGALTAAGHDVRIVVALPPEGWSGCDLVDIDEVHQFGGLAGGQGAKVSVLRPIPIDDPPGS